MEYALSLTRTAATALQAHLLGDRRHEQMAITLCGVNRLPHEVRLLVHDVILLPPDAFRRQSAAGLELKPEIQAFIHQRAHQGRLVQVDWHSHPGAGPSLRFSATDDHYEAAQAAYLAEHMDGVPFGSVVINQDALDARLWVTEDTAVSANTAASPPTGVAPRAVPLRAILTGDLGQRIPLSAQLDRPTADMAVSAIFDRQVRAFGPAFQRKLAALKVGVVGVGALGGALVEHLARLGVRRWVLIDPDAVELSNLNRLSNASLADAHRGRPKVYVARSAIRQVCPHPGVRALRADVFDPAGQRALKSCDLLIAATDNHASRMALNRLAVQYLIPLVHVGFNISADDTPRTAGVSLTTTDAAGPHVTDVSGECVIPELGRWCLQCGGVIDPQRAGWELAPTAQREMLRQRGYLTDTPSPAVHHLDGLVAALAAAEIHNLVWAYKPAQRYLVYDALRSEITPLQVTASHDCPVCSPDSGVLGLGDLEPLPDYRRAARVQLPPAPQTGYAPEMGETPAARPA